jgi:hypothetical protein
MLPVLRLDSSPPIVPDIAVENLSEMKSSPINPSAFKEQMAVLANICTILQ